MGIIERQSIKRTFVQYIGVGIAFLATIFVYSRYSEIYGLVQFVYDAAVLISFFMLLGVNTLPVRFFPGYAHSKDQKSAFFTLLITFGALGALVVTVFIWLLRDWIAPFLSNKNDPLFEQYIFWSVPFAIIISFIKLLNNHISNYKRVVVPAVFGSLIPKVTLPTLIVLVSVLGLTYTQYISFYLGVQIIILTLIILYLNYLEPIRFTNFLKILPKKDFKSMRIFAFYGLFGALGTFLAIRIDTLFVARFIDTDSTGVYKIMTYFTTLIDIPYGAVLAIAAPIVSQNLQKHNMGEVSKIYQTSSRVLLIVGGALFLIIVLNVVDLFKVLPFERNQDLLVVFTVIICLASARLFDLSTSINTHIIVYSKYFRFNFYTIVLLGIFNISLDLFLVPRYGLIGAAVATLISVTLYNLIKLLYIRFRFGIWPYSLHSLNVFLLGFVTFAIIFLIRLEFHPVLNIAIRSLLILLLYVLPLYLLGYLEVFISGVRSSLLGIKNIMR